ncbi:hypothetical protein [Evansella cellulosilytica]|uniref:Uncharacterized protein n=1 Tax=Evansella cellulosilytica (strain ATCC 21833 / DSM 2522 / FERM P-1141 / JCM 9156 / N-4) TaxID=649639 RepID=E6TX76_EVAC2|nr:hypothetical protein [Evansella cellulosilytica]ADU31165.1 hypothetical protein Bcell_2914 [Evansella cellulosilytica DSM 2522]
MITRFIFLFIGFGLAVAGGISLVAYLNLLTVGYTIKDYALFLLGRIEFYIFLLGLLLVWGMIYLPIRRK